VGVRLRTTAKPLAALSALFAVDSLGGGLVIQAVIAYWLHIRFGAGIQVLGPALGAMAFVQAGSFEWRRGWLTVLVW
jgi:hypothetical protein